MINNYEVPEVIEVGRAQHVILGSDKLIRIYDDSPHEVGREGEMTDDE